MGYSMNATASGGIKSSTNTGTQSSSGAKTAQAAGSLTTGAAAKYTSEALNRRKLRKASGIKDLRTATPEQIASLRAKGLLGQKKKNSTITAAPSRAAAFAAVKASRTSQSTKA